MPTEDYNKILVRLIESRVHSIISDTNTFVWLRHTHPEELSHNKEIGGGNLLMSLGLFSALNFMAKLYKILLKGDKCIFKKEEADTLKEFVKKHSEIKKLVQPKVIGQVRNEQNAFIKLVNDSGSKFGLDNEELKTAWKSFRNYLSHSATIFPGHSSVTFLIRGKSFKEFIEKARKRKRPVFLHNQYGLRFYPDILNIEVRYISKWLIEKIKKSEFNDKNIKTAFEWVEDWAS